MKKIAIIFGLMLSSVANSAVDYGCAANCRAKGFQYGYCQSACSYDTAPSLGGRTDYQCQSACQAKGYMFNYCKQACSY